MRSYLDLLRHILDHGVRKPTRTVAASTGQPLDAVSVFGHQLRFDLTQGFPAVTTKQLGFKTMAHELRWFLRGETNIRTLRERKVHIWDEWADENGDLGPIYGQQWRRWRDPDGGTIDQVQRLLDGIAEVKANPRASVGRRLILSAWNVADIPRMKLAPCHVLAHFMVTDGRLSCLLYQRSADVFLGVPFNIASYALLTHLVAHVSGLNVGEFIHTFGDVHIYENHVDAVRTQLEREPYPLPRLRIDPTVTSLDGWDVEQVGLVGYRHHPRIEGEVAV